MKVSKLKSVPLMTCCLAFALFAKSQGMDDASELREVTSYKANHSGSYLDGLKPEINNDSQDKALLLLQDEEEKLEASWASYVTSPIKAVIDGTYNIADFAVKHPTQTIMTSLLIAAQYTSVAAWSFGGGVNIPFVGGGSLGFDDRGFNVGVNTPFVGLGIGADWGGRR